MSRITTWSARQIILATVLVLAIGAGFWLFFQVGWVTFIFFVAFVMGTALKPVTDWFGRRNIPQTWAIAAVYLFSLLTLAAILLLLLPPLVEQVLRVAVEVPTYYTWFRNTLLNSSNLFLQQISWQLPPALSINLSAQTPPADSVETVQEGFNSLSFYFKAVFMTIATFMLSFYWTLDGQQTVQSISLLVPINRRDGMRDLVKAVEYKVGAYVRGQIILCVVIGAMALVAYMLIGLPNALALALFAGVMEIVPIFGPTIGAIPAILMAAPLGFETVVWVVAATLAIQQLENSFILPRIMDRSVGVHPIVTLLAFFTLGSILGILGAILAVPLAAVIQLMLDRFILKATPGELNALADRDETARLRYELQELAHDIRKQAGQASEIPTEENNYVEAELETIANELANYLAQSEPSEISS